MGEFLIHPHPGEQYLPMLNFTYKVRQGDFFTCTGTGRVILCFGGSTCGLAPCGLAWPRAAALYGPRPSPAPPKLESGTLWKISLHFCFSTERRVKVEGFMERREDGWRRRTRQSKVISGKSKAIKLLQSFFLDLLRNFNNIYVMFLILRNVRSRYRVNQNRPSQPRGLAVAAQSINID